MFGLDLLPPEALGVMASFVAGLITLIPALGKSDQSRAAVSIVVLVVAVLAQYEFSFVSWQEFGNVLLTAAVYAVVSYKMVLQPLVLPRVAQALNAVGVSAKAHG